ncbi:iron-containing alcohol dehydrogenase [Desulfobaculum bizertense]|uniref:iron-containing alcohol dehydrogenase family protein n=1 Tax=Desulfobaculum bizertense TaxID=376490 RepID=UPI001F2FACD2|nr:iron-containing alcohol dehydrogenase [Desulfobaculum bizertense]UIJ36830.1 iron-containing alcohol dehydrogenase [Desulfobaculum bizertense]
MNILPQELRGAATCLSGAGSIHNLSNQAILFGKRGVLVHGASLAAHGVLQKIQQDMSADTDCLFWQHPGGEPTLAQLEELLEAARKHGAEWIAAVGGGSVLDIAKACAGMFHQPGTVVEYHDGAEPSRESLPLLAAPTTAGTGSEATPVSVLTNTETGVKKSFRTKDMYAKVVILDPVLLQHCPSHVLTASGMDAITQAVESYTSRHATWYSRELAAMGFELLANTLPLAFAERNETGSISEERAEALLYGSYITGVAFSSSRLGVVHGLAHPLGARFHVPHGVCCGICLPYALELNRDSVQKLYTQLCDILGEDLIEWVRQQLSAFGMENPFSGKTLADTDAVVEEILVSGSTKANPVTVTEDIARDLLKKILA